MIGLSREEISFPELFSFLPIVLKMFPFSTDLRTFF